ncbi:hypothetical protein EJ06DRAFT_556906 [Trichodelitschia bisporula]|uniref:Uncharacterized protein n=1 Tax=Trichodelitschia bisporula TaxID=703511 RepID=A0A6G1HVN3_9PEZI|nr:hypothetical protein EJ06DRAFT_556906 [Trichodelitschia bisporula]
MICANHFCCRASSTAPMPHPTRAPARVAPGYIVTVLSLWPAYLMNGAFFWLRTKHLDLSAPSRYPTPEM